MPIGHSKATAQGQISVSAEVRKKLGVGPGFVLDGDERATSSWRPAVIFSDSLVVEIARKSGHLRVDT